MLIHTLSIIIIFLFSSLDNETSSNLYDDLTNPQLKYFELFVIIELFNYIK